MSEEREEVQYVKKEWLRERERERESEREKAWVRQWVKQWETKREGESEGRGRERERVDKECVRESFEVINWDMQQDELITSANDHPAIHFHFSDEQKF